MFVDISNFLWWHGLVVITTAQLRSTKPELRFCAGSKHARSMSQIPEFLKTTARSTFRRNIPWKISDFFRTKNGFKKRILSQIELIRH